MEDIPSDILKDVFGEGWKFEPGGVLRTDVTAGDVTGSWRLEGENTLYLKERLGDSDRKFEIRFTDGYMYLKGADGRYMIMERNKFFGF